MNQSELKTHFKIAKERGNNLQAYCPAHEDKNASLSITFTNDKALIFCHAGCMIENVLKAANLTFGDLYTNGHRPIGIYQYRKADGSLSHEKVKFPAPPPKNKEFFQRHVENGQIVDNLNGITHIPYNLPELTQAIKQGQTILYCEGEKDANTARLLGYVSTTMGGASDWKDEYKHYFKGASIIQIPDKDDAGLGLASKVTDSLKTVAKSLKVVILPGAKDIKDLTNWVESGNNQLQPLIEQATELITENWLSGLVMSKTNTGYSFKLDQMNLEVRVERLTNDLESILKVYDHNKLLRTAKINLLAPRTVTEFANQLAKIRAIKWDELLSAITNQCSEAISDAGQIDVISLEPVTMEVEYLLYPILPLKEPTTIYTAGGKGKSIMCDYFSVILTHCYLSKALPLIPRKCNVLYLDWESDVETHRRYITAIKRGLNLADNPTPIYYRNLDNPLAQVIDHIKLDIEKWDIGLVIIDSQMAATASGTRGMTEAQVASEYYNLLRSLNCTTLTIDHITKNGMANETGAEAPFGSIVKYNRSRSQFELRLPDEAEDSDHKEYALIHRKFNLGRKQKPIGIAVDFQNDANELVSIVFSSFNIADNQILSKNLKQWERIFAVLTEPKTPAQIANDINDPTKMPVGVVSTVLKRYHDKFTQIDATNNKWAKLAVQSDNEKPEQSGF